MIMKRVAYFVLAVSVLLSPGDVIGQSLKYVIRKTVVEPTKTANDVAMDKAEEKGEEEAEKAITNAIMEGFGISENVVYERDYKFESWFQMQVTEYKKNGKVDDQVLYDNYVSKETQNYGMEFSDDDSRSTIVFDSERLEMIILADNDGEKTGFATTIDSAMVEEAVEEESDYTGFKPLKTGNTKKILGYTCDEYLVDDEDTEVHMWISEKLGKEINKDMLTNSNTFGAAFQHSRAVKGMILEYNLIDKDDGERTEMLVTDLDLNRNHSISTGDYTIITMNIPD
jgi:hypothetical protein